MLINQEALIGCIETIGYVGLVAIVFCETGLFFGFILPGDSLLFLAGLLASREVFSISILIPVLVAASFLGYVFGYWFGLKLDDWLLARPDSFWFKKSYIEKTHRFYEKHGYKAILVGRMVPVVRTFCGIVAGVAQMNLRVFLIYNVLGSVLWVCLFTVLGYFLGDAFPGLLDYIVFAVLFIILLSVVVPVCQQYFKKS